MNTPRPILPHTGPMHWLDTATLSPDGQTATATCTLIPAHPFLSNNTLLPSALIELMAQTAAAGTLIQPTNQTRRLRRGLLAAIRDFHLYPNAHQPTVGATITLTAAHEKSFATLISARLEARINTHLLASARMTFHLEFE